MIAEQPLTEGTIAVLNLDAQINARHAEVGLGAASVETRMALADLIALRDLDRAELLWIDGDTANSERAAILQAVGRYDDALRLRQEAVAREASFEHVAALVSLHAARGEQRSRSAASRKAATATTQSRRFRSRCSNSSSD